MPLYFAYGANIDRTAMLGRCPGSRLLGPGILARHRFFIMPDGYASVRAEQDCEVHGLVWDLAPADVPALDDFEEVARGLYSKAMRPVRRAGLTDHAMIYLGHSESIGQPRPGYMEAVLAAAVACGFPEIYLAELRSWASLTSTRNGGAF